MRLLELIEQDFFSYSITDSPIRKCISKFRESLLRLFFNHIPNPLGERRIFYGIVYSKANLDDFLEENAEKQSSSKVGFQV